MTMGLERECELFTALIARRPPSPYVVRKYLEAHRVHPVLERAAGFEARLLHAATSGRIAARLADAYARHMLPRGVLRKKLVLLFAILETAPGFHRQLTFDTPRTRLGVVTTLAAAGAAGLAATAGGFLVFGVLHLITDRRPPS
jgi:hypothetical protein